ncbi:MAG: hypothetical protein IJF33_02975 [Clostridia bacterium]|nr:hypothetical protein [Clostridia bacterium]
MIKNTKRPNTEIFWLELALAILIPFIICWTMIPTNILNSNSLFRLLESIGLCGSTLIFFFGIPVGIIGIIKAKGIEKRRIATIALSILNLSAGIIEIVMLILIFYAVVFRGASV